jgi:hypothetical protein
MLTSFNGHPAVKCQSAKAAEQVAERLIDAGYAVRVKIIKAKPKCYQRFFLVFPYEAAKRGIGVKQRGSTESPPSVEELHTH